MNIIKNNISELVKTKVPVLAGLFIVFLSGSCNNEMEPVDTARDTQFTVAEFPAFDQPQSRTVGTPDNGKTNWEKGDEILMRAHTGSVNADQYFSLVYDGGTWSGTYFPYEYEIPQFTAYYAPNSEWTSGDAPVLKTGAIGGTDEYLKGKVTQSDGSFLISFDKTQRTYSRFRVATFPNETVKYENNLFVSADGTNISLESKELTADQNGNIFIYGSIKENGYIYFENSTSTIKVNYDNTYVAGKSYVIDLSSPYRTDGDVITIRLNSLTDSYLSSLMQIVSATEGINTIVVKGEPTISQQNIIAEAIKNKTLTLCMPNTNKADIIDAIKNASGITLIPGYEIDNKGIYLLYAGDCVPAVVDKVKASGKDCTLKLMKDITVNQDLYIENNSSLTIDLCNYTIKNENLRNPLFRIVKGTLTVISSDNGKIKVENCTIFRVKKEGNLVINGGTFENGSQYIVDNYESDAKTTINGGTFNSKLTPVYVQGTCVINDGIFSGNQYAFECANDSYITIYGGSFTGEKADLNPRKKTGILNFNTQTGKGAVFPGGISRTYQTGFDLNKLLSSGAGYFDENGNSINVQDGYNSCIDKGDVIVKKK